jgi:hypothetical protein
MRDRRAQLLVVAATMVVAFIGILLVANLNPVDHQCAWQFPKIMSCLLSARETLSAGLIATGGAVFAGWLAYSAAIEASDRALSEARSAKHEALTQRVATLSEDIDRLKLAKAYLETFASNFPSTSAGSTANGFAQILRQCHAKALDVVSSSAIRAPFGYGAQISTVMTRIETLGERIEETLFRNQAINVEVTWQDQVYEMIQGIRSIAAQIGGDIPVHEKRLRRLADERDAAA